MTLVVDLSEPLSHIAKMLQHLMNRIPGRISPPGSPKEEPGSVPTCRVMASSSGSGAWSFGRLRDVPMSFQSAGIEVI